MSDAIPPGVRWSEAIGGKLSDARIGVLCITPENTDAPWLVFEAGALSNRFGDARVIPLLLDMSPRDLDGPINQFQAVTISRENMRRLAEGVNELLGNRRVAPEVLAKSLSANWRAFSEKVERARAIPLEGTSARTVLKALRRHGLPEPSDGRSLNFSGGFESHALYEALFSLARKRLYIFGRKNRKAFDKEHDSFFQRLPAATAKGFDFRCLFLDPAAPKHVIRGAHADPDLPQQLRRCLDAARSRLRKHKLDPKQFCRLYSMHRAHAVVAIDDLVLVAPVGLDGEAQPAPLTKCPFKLLDADDSFAGDLVSGFLAVWEHAKPLTA